MKKKYSVIFIFMAFVISLSVFSKIKHGVVYADDVNIETVSKSAYLIDPFSKTVIYSKNETERLPIASMCKIMTLLLVFDEIEAGNIKFNEEVVISENASGMGGSQVFLEANASYTVDSLIKSITVASANDASVAMAEKICCNEDDFVLKMNEKAKSLGMINTNFVNCTGLPKPGQYCSAKDVAIMFSELIKHKEYFNYSRIWTDEISHPNDRKTEISNTNKLIRFYQGCDGGKTGYTSEAGHCLVASAHRNGMRLISVVISSPDSKTRFNEVSKMFNYGFANYVNKLIVDDKKPLDIKVEVDGGKKDTLSVTAKKPVFLFSNKNEKRSVDIEFIPNEKIKAPVFIGDTVGKIEVYENGKIIASVEVVSLETVDKETYFDSIKDVIDNWGII